MFDYYIIIMILCQKIIFSPIAEGGAKTFCGISCEKSRFYAKKSYFFQLRREARKFFGVFRVKNHDFTPKNLIFSNFRGGGGRRLDPPLISMGWWWCLFVIGPIRLVGYYSTSSLKQQSKVRQITPFKHIILMLHA